MKHHLQQALRIGDTRSRSLTVVADVSRAYEDGYRARACLKGTNYDTEHKACGLDEFGRNPSEALGRALKSLGEAVQHRDRK
jgi:hypothetical protein